MVRRRSRRNLYIPPRDLAPPLPKASAYFSLPIWRAKMPPLAIETRAASMLTCRNQRRTNGRRLRRLDGKLIDHALDARGIGRDLLRAFFQIGVVDIA